MARRPSQALFRSANGERVLDLKKTLGDLECFVGWDQGKEYSTARRLNITKLPVFVWHIFGSNLSVMLEDCWKMPTSTGHDGSQIVWKHDLNLCGAVVYQR